jgi:UDP-GlcNAc:undecaprenyl-phosphate GlcNAc-1-phosphate transferase
VYSLALLAFSSFLLALFLTPLCRNLFRRWGWVDRPDGQRKLHSHPVPRAGGVPIMLAYLGAFGLLLAFPLAAGTLVKVALPLAEKILWATAVVFAVGLLDDVRGLKPWEKFAGQVTAGCLAFGAGVDITHVGGLGVPVWLSLPLTVLWLVGCSNAFNLIDGVDGLAAGAGLFATVTILLGGLLNGNLPLAMATLPLAGALLGFLRYNFNPASIFLGDSGSLTVGFLLGCYGIMWSQKSTTVLGMTAPLMALAVPLLDTGVSIARRFLRQQPVFAGDAGHIHHRLLARGLTPRRVALLLYGACGLAAAMSLLASVRANKFAGVVIVLFCGAAWIGVQHLGYVEFGVVGRMFVDGAFRRQLNGQIALQALEETLTKTQDSQAHWIALCEICRRFGFTRVELRVNGSFRSEVLLGTDGAAGWSLSIPLADDSFLCLMHGFGGAPSPAVLMPFAEVLHKSFRGAPLAVAYESAGEDEPAAMAAYAADTEPGSGDHDRSVRDLAQGAEILVYGAQYRPEQLQGKKKARGHSSWLEGTRIARENGLAEDRRRSPRLRRELPVHIRWRDVDGRLVETQGLTRDFSKSGIYFTAPAEINTQHAMELSVKLPEEIMAGTGPDVRYLTEFVRRENLDGTTGFTSPAVGVAARFFAVARGAEEGSLAA